MSTSTGRYDPAVTIAAVADPGRRHILDVLRTRDGRSVGALEEALSHLGRHAVLKHVRVLETAGLVVTVKVGRRRLCYLNPVPLLDLAQQWSTDYSAGWGRALVELRASAETLERTAMTEHSDDLAAAPPDLVQQVVVHASAQRVWEAIATSRTREWYFATALSSAQPGHDFTMDDADGVARIRGTILEADPPRLLVQRFRACWDDDVAADPPSHVTWRLEERGPLTVVTLEHRGVAGTETGRQAVGGWPYLLSQLKTYLETGAPMPAPSGA